MLNKTPKVSAKKIKLALKAALGVLFLGIVAILTMGISKDKSPENCSGISCYHLERADSSSERAQGLSGRTGLKPKTGMLFVFDRPDKQCFWMKDMQFPIDMIWADSNKKIIKIEKNVSPTTYPEQYCADNTQYVVELANNETDVLQLAVGTQLSFK